MVLSLNWYTLNNLEQDFKMILACYVLELDSEWYDGCSDPWDVDVVKSIMDKYGWSKEDIRNVMREHPEWTS